MNQTIEYQSTQRAELIQCGVDKRGKPNEYELQINGQRMKLIKLAEKGWVVEGGIKPFQAPKEAAYAVLYNHPY